MFSKAYEIARDFTFPFVISSRNAKGECSAGIGAFVVINEDGWCVTAFHIIKQILDQQESLKTHTDLIAKRRKIEESGLLPQQIKNKLKAIPIDNSLIQNIGVTCGWPDAKLGTIHAIPAVDLAVFQLQNFDKSRVKNYPVFKSSNKDMKHGTSLCKLGFPFHEIKPTYENGSFNLPTGSFPIPIFPIDGILTRTVHVATAQPTQYPLMYVETSSPGLRGQSGGPTIDTSGVIWAIQSQTQSFPLGFGTNHSGKKKELEHIQNQYLNVGLGVHSETITMFLKEKNIQFQSI